MSDNWAWSQKEQAATKAREHTQMIDHNYSKHTALTVANSIVYGGDMPMPKREYIEEIKYNHPTVKFLNTDTITAAKEFAQQDLRVCILNFASYKHPGGMFLKGSMAQEEAICHSTNLYNVLRQFEPYYLWNKRNTNNDWYENRAIYSPNVLVFKDDVSPFIPTIDVITCAAPNLRRHLPVSQGEIMGLYLSRFTFIMDIFYASPADVFILGAFGCGVFRNDPYLVREGFVATMVPRISSKNPLFVFAVPGGPGDKNHDTFCTIEQEYNSLYRISRGG